MVTGFSTFTSILISKSDGEMIFDNAQIMDYYIVTCLISEDNN